MKAILILICVVVIISIVLPILGAIVTGIIDKGKKENNK
tara:strand:- start:423 stop:539 length:117 start_codon:yes stop_codon:yes gene_type:complete